MADKCVKLTELERLVMKILAAEFHNEENDDLIIGITELDHSDNYTSFSFAGSREDQPHFPHIMGEIFIDANHSIGSIALSFPTPRLMIRFLTNFDP